MLRQNGAMQVFIDESGTFNGFHEGSIGVVGALAIPDGKLEFIAKKYAKLREKFPKENGEVKGRLLNEEQINEVVNLLARNEVIFEATALDLGLHTEEGVKGYKKKLGDEMLAKVKNFDESVQAEVQKASEEIHKTSVPLFLQALTTFDVLHRLIGHMAMFYAQRRAQELGEISWVVDGKDPQKVTRWEEWWSHYAQGALATMSRRRPTPHLVSADYSHYKKSYGNTDAQGEEGTDLKKLLKDIRFSKDREIGLELVDILTNAIRRTLTGNLQKEGWRNIHKVMIHRNEDKYIQFILLAEGPDVWKNAKYAKAVNEGFADGGKSMLTPSNLTLVGNETEQEAVAVNARLLGLKGDA
jgi:hypothetical protein